MGTMCDQDKPCSRDPVFAEFVKEFGSFTTTEARLVLVLHALLLYFDNGRIEVGNAALRREVVRRVQAKKIDVEDLASLWIAVQCRSKPFCPTLD